MNFNQRLNTTISTTNSILCVGLDPDLNKIPNIMKSDSEPLYPFCAEIIEHTKPFCAAFKINFAFFEAEGAKGWEALARVVDLIPQGIIKSADAKRADIGNSSLKYAEAILQQLNFDVVTVNPYMGKDSVAPFIQ